MGSSLIDCATRIEIADDVLIAWGCNIVDHDSHSIAWSNRANDVRDWYLGRNKKDWSHVVSRPVKIGNKCWIGMHAIILKGVEIGEGASRGCWRGRHEECTAMDDCFRQSGQSDAGDFH